jgi:cytochrome c
MRLGWILAGCCAASVMLARVHPMGDAGLYTPKQGMISQTNVPKPVRDLLQAKCADCHSTATRAPIYGRFAPASWLMERDILEGRKRLNLSAWEKYSPEEQDILRAKMANEVMEHEMPLLQYRLIHWGSRINDADVKILRAWAKGEPVDMAPAADAGDATRGKIVFEKRCTGCHAIETNREGPKLKSVVGRTSGTVDGFTYSDALKKAKIVWKEETIAQWLTDPEAMVPGTEMDFHVAKPQERKDVARYLATLGNQ